MVWDPYLNTCAGKGDNRSVGKLEEELVGRAGCRKQNEYVGIPKHNTTLLTTSTTIMGVMLDLMTSWLKMRWIQVRLSGDNQEKHRQGSPTNDWTPLRRRLDTYVDVHMHPSYL